MIFEIGLLYKNRSVLYKDRSATFKIPDAWPQVKLVYAVTNFQNPTGITYSRSKRQEIVDVLKDHSVSFIEDNPYSDLRFMGEEVSSINAKLV